MGKLVRKNVLLFEEHFESIRYKSHFFDMSCSEIIRIYCCLGRIELMKTLHKEFKPKTCLTHVNKFIKECKKTQTIDNIKKRELINLIYKECKRSFDYN